MVDFYN
jgi:predicted TPR repeat methyltransferase